MNQEQLLRPDGVSDFKWRFMLWKRYFDTGYGMTGYIKYIVALFGISSLNVERTLMLGFVYAIFCFVLGYAWFRYHFAELDQEIGNRYNWFVQEMREMKKGVEQKTK